MQRAGFILAGGRSSRMGSDKALLPWQGTTLLENLAKLAAGVAGCATIIGQRAQYDTLGIPVLPDLRPGFGPLSGLETALLSSRSEWNLVLACDLMNVNNALLLQLFDRVESTDLNLAVVRDSTGSIHPLCAVYRRRCLGAVSRSLDRHDLRLLTLVDALEPAFVDTGYPLLNINTPEEWLAARGR